MSRRVSPAQVARLRVGEELRLTAYLCPSRIPTIGYGHTGPDVRLLMPAITKEQAEEFLAADVDFAANLVTSAVKVPLNQNQFDAMVSLLFNVGPGRKAKPGDPGRDGIITLANGQPSTLLKLLNAGSYSGAAAQFERWCHSTDEQGRLVKLKGLESRREAEMNLFLTPVST